MSEINSENLFITEPEMELHYRGKRATMPIMMTSSSISIGAPPPMKIEKLKADVSINSRDMRLSEAECREFARDEMARKLGQALLDQGFVDIKECEFIDTMEYIFRGTIQVVKP